MANEIDDILFGNGKNAVLDLVPKLETTELKLLDWKVLSEALELQPVNDQNTETEKIKEILGKWTENTYKTLQELVHVIGNLCQRPLLAEHVKNEYWNMGRLNVGGTKIYYSPGTTLGNNQLGASIIYKGHYCELSQPAAIKELEQQKRKFRKDSLGKVVSILKNSSSYSKNVVRIFGFGLMNSKLYIAMETNGFIGTMSSEIKRHGVKTATLRLYLNDISFGMEWLHDNNIIHGNINSSNVLLYEYSSGKKLAKLSDFALSPAPNNEFESTDYIMDDDMKLSKPKDICSLGKLFYYTISRGKHFNLVDRNSNTLRTVFQDANNICHWMTHSDPKFRPNMNQIINHPFFWDELKCLQFIGDVSRSASNPNDKYWPKIKERLNYAYSESFVRKLKSQNTFDWRVQIPDERFYEPNNKKSKKSAKSATTGNTKTEDGRYDTTHFMDLVKLIRDKEQHFAEINPSLLGDEFMNDKGEPGFCRKKYSDYFLKKFTDMVILLFCALSNISDKASVLNTLKFAYFRGYSSLNSEHCWKDPFVANFLKDADLDEEVSKILRNDT